MVPLLLLTIALLGNDAVNGDEHFDLLRTAMQNPDLFGGDMVVNMDVDRNVIPEQSKRWTGARVPYFIDPSLKDHEDMIQQAIDEYHSKTCVRFESRRPEEQNYIRIFPGQGCYSQVGMMGGQQTISLGEGCLYVGIIIHELGHALGFWHEHNRSDRDDYLDIYLENVIEGMEFNFQKLHPTQNLLLTPFDYDSIMIYGNDEFSKDGSMTMRAKDGRQLLNPYKKHEMANSDVQRINKMYCGST